MGPRVDVNEWVLFLFISIFLYMQVCSNFFIHIIFFLKGKVKILLNLYEEFFYKK